MTIDYERMKREWPRQKAALKAAQDLTDPDERVAAIENVCIAAVTVWDQVGVWPDDWAHFERALHDAHHWTEQISLEELVARHRAEERQAEADRRAAVAAAQADAQREHDEQYPEHAKLTALDGKNDLIGEFIDWLDSEGYTIGQYNPNSNRLYPAEQSPTQLIGAFFGIDPKALSREKDRMLAALRGEQVAS